MFHVKHSRKALIHKDLCVKQNKPTADIHTKANGWDIGVMRIYACDRRVRFPPVPQNVPRETFV